MHRKTFQLLIGTENNSRRWEWGLVGENTVVSKIEAAAPGLTESPVNGFDTYGRNNPPRLHREADPTDKESRR